MILSVSNLKNPSIVSTHAHQVLSGAFDVAAGECVALTGPSGCGKSSLMRMIYGNYRLCRTNPDRGHRSGHGDTTRSDGCPTICGRLCGQFLRVLPRIPTIKVAEPFIRAGGEEIEATQRAGELLARLRIPENLWSLSPLTFSGANSKVNIARGLSIPTSCCCLTSRPPVSTHAMPDRCRADRKSPRRGDGRHFP